MASATTALIWAKSRTWTCCLPCRRTHSHQTRLDRSQPQRDAGPGERREQEKPLYEERERHAGAQLAWVHLSQSAEFLCPTAFSSQVPGRKEAGGREGQSRFLKRKLTASAERRDSYPCVARSGQVGEVTSNNKNPIIDYATWNTPGQNSPI